MRTNQFRRFGLLVVLAVVVGGCGGGDGEQAIPPGTAPASSPGASSGSTAGDGGIVIKNFVYSPIPAEVNLGESITVTNEDRAAHTLTVPGGVDSGNLAQGKSFTFTPTEAGDLDYLCDIHQYMKGRIVVR